MMPNVSGAIRRFEESLQFQLVAKTIVDGDLAEASAVKPTLWFEGVLQPIPPSKLLVKPEGMRSFQWWTLTTDLDIARDQIIKDEAGRSFRVMDKTDWNAGGFFAYELIEGPGV